MTKKLYSLTDEHRAQLKPWSEWWIDNAMSTKPMDDEERALCTEAINGMYAAAKLPPPKRIVFVPSPFVLRFASGFAAWWWYLKNNPKKTYVINATDAATADAAAATNDATHAAINAATHAAINDATHDAAYAATHDATHAATHDAINDATYAATYAAHAAISAANDDGHRWYSFDVTAATQAARRLLGHVAAPLLCAQKAWSMWSGGNQWSGWSAYLSFFRDVANLKLPEYEAYRHWDILAKHSGPRIVHKDFCMISDRPEVLTVDAEHRPHGEAGPFCRWRDGSALFAWHGTRVPRWIVESPERITPALIEAENNVEIRRVMIERFGVVRYVTECFDGEPVTDDWGKLYRKARPNDSDLVIIRMVNSSPEPGGAYKEYFERVPPHITTPREGLAWQVGMEAEQYHPSAES